MVYVYKREQRYWLHYRTVRVALELLVTAGAVALFSYLILQVRW